MYFFGALDGGMVENLAETIMAGVLRDEFSKYDLAVTVSGALERREDTGEWTILFKSSFSYAATHIGLGEHYSDTKFGAVRYNLWHVIPESIRRMSCPADVRSGLIDFFLFLAKNTFVQAVRPKLLEAGFIPPLQAGPLRFCPSLPFPGKPVRVIRF